MNCPKCAEEMVVGAIAIDAPGDSVLRALGGRPTTRSRVLQIKFLANGGKESEPRLEGTAWMCDQCDTVILIGGW